MKSVKLWYKEKHLNKDVKISPVTKIEIICNDDDLVNIPVFEGVAYAPVARNNYTEVLAALKDSPEELAKNPDIKLIYIKENKKGD